MTERPILFSAPMVRAILSGAKSQTRRIVKPQPLQRPGMNCTRTVFFDRKGRELLDTVLGPNSLAESLCPYGQPVDRLWVREAWRAEREFDAMPPRDIPPTSVVGLEAGRECWPDPAIFGKLRPSMFMPRWASRITLEITDVRVERLQDISEADAKAEGAPLHNSPAAFMTCHRLGFRDLWESINGPGSWEVNPVVWVVEFKRVQA